MLNLNHLPNDDTLDAFGMHGLVGVVGAILTGVFATSVVSLDGAGFIDGNPWEVLLQLKSVGATVIYSAVVT